MTGVEEIREREQLLALIYSAELHPTKTTFITPDSLLQQVGFIVYAAGGEVVPHVHRSITRELVGTAEVLVVWEGRCEVDLYDERRILIATRELAKGDVIVLVAGGHGFRMLEDTVFLEVKQGPYTGIDERETF